MRQLAAVAPEHRSEDHVEVMVDPISAFKLGTNTIGEAFFSPQFIAEVNAYSGSPEAMGEFIIGLMNTYFEPIVDDGVLQAMTTVLMLGSVDAVTRGAQRNAAIDTLRRNIQPLPNRVPLDTRSDRRMSTTKKAVLVGAAGLGIILLVRLASK